MEQPLRDRIVKKMTGSWPREMRQEDRDAWLANAEDAIMEIANEIEAIPTGVSLYQSVEASQGASSFKRGALKMLRPA